MCYLLFAFLPVRRAWVACIGALLVIFAGDTKLKDVLFTYINWNVMGLFVGTLVIAELFMLSRAPAVAAEWLVDKTGTVRGAMIAICALSGFFSMFVENVAVVLLISPVSLSLVRKFNLSPVTLLLLVAMSANIQGTATMVGDPPAMILAGYMKMGFNDFFFYQGRLSIFFAVEFGAIITLAIMFFILRKLRYKIDILPVEKIRSWMPVIFLIIFIAGLSISSLFDPDFKWFAGTFTIVMGMICFCWYCFIVKWGTARQLLRELDWNTTFFLIGIFIIVGALSNSGWIDKLAAWIINFTGLNVVAAYIFFTAIAMLVSGFIDNVPFMLIMLPVVQKVAESINVPVSLFLFGLLCGVCMGGNLTPIGASANVVTLGILRKQGHVVSFREYLKIGVPVTIISTACSAWFVWLVWR